MHMRLRGNTDANVAAHRKAMTATRQQEDPMPLEQVPDEEAARTLAHAAVTSAMEGKPAEAYETLGYAKDAAIRVCDAWSGNDAPELTRDQGVALAAVVTADRAIESLYPRQQVV